MTSDPHHPDELLDAWLDDRLEADDKRRVDEHLAACGRCRRQVEVLRATVAAVRSGLPTPPPPQGLAARIGAALDAEDARAADAARVADDAPPLPAAAVHPSVRRPFSAPFWRWTAAAAAAAVAVLAVALWLGPETEPAPSAGLVADFDAAYVELAGNRLPAALASADAGEVERRWRDGELGFRTRVFDLEAMGIYLAGGGAAEVGGRRAAMTAYRGDGDLLLCWMFEGRESDLPAGAEVRRERGFTFHVYQRGDRTLVFWQEGEVLCALAGRGDPEGVVALAVAKAMAPAAGRAA